MRLIFRQAARLMGTSAANGDLSPRFCSACRHPLALILLFLSIAGAAVEANFNLLDVGPSVWWLGILVGLSGYLTTVAVARWVQPELMSPELDELNSIRDFMKGKLAEKSDSFQLALLLSRAVQQLDAKVVPTLRRLIERQYEQADLLERYETGQLPSPTAPDLEKLKSKVERQKAVIAESVERVSAGVITFVDLMQESEGNLDTPVDAWFRNLSELYDIIAEVMNDDEGPSALKTTRMEPGAMHTVSAQDTSQEDGEHEAFVDFREHVESALRRLNNLAALSKSELVCRLPRTLAASAGQQVQAQTPIENARTLQRVLIAGIDMLKPANGNLGISSGGALQFNILNEQYIERRPNAYIWARYAMSESVFFRTRKDAITAVVQHLEAQESNLETCVERNGDLTFAL